MTDFLAVDFGTDTDTLTSDAIEYLRANIPGWVPADGNLEVWLIAAVARMNAETATVASTATTGIFREYGRQIIGLTPVDGSAATVVTFWTARDALGHTIPAGTQVGYRVSGDALIVFEATADVVIAPGASTLGGVTLTAVGVGTAWNGVPAGPLELVDSLSWVSDVSASSASSGGVDAETDDAYLARLVAELRLSAPRPILPDDFSTLARRITGVYRALTVDGWDPGAGTGGHERMVCVFPLDQAGAAVSSTIRGQVGAYLDGLREVNFVVNTGTPTSTTINVAFTVHVDTGYDPATVVAAAEAAVTAYLSPANWGGGDQSPPVWRAGDNKVRFNAVINVIGNVAGVAYVAALTVNTGTSDVTLAGAAPLPAVGSVTGASL